MKLADCEANGLSALIGTGQVFHRVRLADKPAVLRWLALRAAERTGIDSQVIFAKLVARERLGSTGVGDGVALPHTALPGLQRPFALFVSLDVPVNYDAADQRTVDLVFLLLTSPNAASEHLKILAQAARALRDPERQLRARLSRDTVELHRVVTAIG